MFFMTLHPNKPYLTPINKRPKRSPEATKTKAIGNDSQSGCVIEATEFLAKEFIV